MDDREREHPDEGTIHAWLDGALDDASARTLAAHVAACPTCAERVAEARGLIAGASRIVGALDDSPSTAGPAWGQPVAAAPASVKAARKWRLLRVTPARAAIAATVLVALGVSITYERTATESEATRAVAERADLSASAKAPAAAAVPAPAMTPRVRDRLLDSAVARNLAAVQPPRAVRAAPGPDVPAPPLRRDIAAVDSAAPSRVASGRAAYQVQRDSGGGVASDQLRSRVPIPAGRDQPAVATARVDTVGAASGQVMDRASAGAAMAQSSVVGLATAPQCYRVETANGIAATWGADGLPLVVRVDSLTRGAAVLTVAGQPTGSQAVVTRAAGDSLLLRLRRLGYEGTLALGAVGDVRAGVMRSRPLEGQLSELVVTGASPEVSSAAPRRRAAPAQVAKSAPAPAAAANEARTAAPAVPIVARRIRCPG
jgi:hypothetical protein